MSHFICWWGYHPHQHNCLHDHSYLTSISICKKAENHQFSELNINHVLFWQQFSNWLTAPFSEKKNYSVTPWKSIFFKWANISDPTFHTTIIPNIVPMFPSPRAIPPTQENTASGILQSKRALTLSGDILINEPSTWLLISCANKFHEEHLLTEEKE